MSVRAVGCTLYLREEVKRNPDPRKILGLLRTAPREPPWAGLHLKLFSDDTQIKLLSLVRHSQTLNWQDVDWVRPYRANTLVHSRNPCRRELPGSSLTCAYANTLSKKETLKSHSEDRADSNTPEPTSKNWALWYSSVTSALRKRVPRTCCKPV